jgi:predicted lipid-binding transport protein (Tim44 family)
VAEEGSLLAQTLERMREIDPGFSARHFLDGAGVAYEMIVTAYAEGDKRALKPLLARDVFQQFSEVIDARRKAGQKLELQFVGLDEAKLVDASLDGTTARLTVRFKSKVISVLRDGKGEIIEGDPHKLKTVRDVWTFERDLTSSNPNWTLVETQAPD